MYSGSILALAYLGDKFTKATTSAKGKSENGGHFDHSLHERRRRAWHVTTALRGPHTLISESVVVDHH